MNNEQHGILNISDRMPTLLTLHYLILPKDQERIIEHKGSSFEVERIVFALVFFILRIVPFKSHCYTNCITLYSCCRQQVSVVSAARTHDNRDHPIISRNATL